MDKIKENEITTQDIANELNSNIDIVSKRISFSKNTDKIIRSMIPILLSDDDANSKDNYNKIFELAINSLFNNEFKQMLGKI